MIAVKDFGMFTERGNSAVGQLVALAKTAELTWPQTYRALLVLSEQDKFGEATDTEVREMVYSALNFKTPFYF